MAESYCVWCPVAGWESEPMNRDEAAELLDEPGYIHPFEGSCRSSHSLVKYNS